MLDKTKTSSRKDKPSVTLAWARSRGWCPRPEDSWQLVLSMVKTLLTTNQMALKKRPVTKGKTIWKVIFRDDRDNNIICEMIYVINIDIDINIT